MSRTTHDSPDPIYLTITRAGLNPVYTKGDVSSPELAFPMYLRVSHHNSYYRTPKTNSYKGLLLIIKYFLGMSQSTPVFFLFVMVWVGLRRIDST